MMVYKLNVHCSPVVPADLVCNLNVLELLALYDSPLGPVSDSPLGTHIESSIVESLSKTRQLV